MRIHIKDRLFFLLSNFKVQGSGLAPRACRLMITGERGSAGSIGSRGSKGGVRRITIKSAAEV